MKLSFHNNSLSEIKAEAKKFKYRSDFQKAHPGIFTTLSRRKIIDQVCSHMIAKPRSSLIKDEIIKKVNQYDYREELLKENPNLVHQAIRFKIPLPPYLVNKRSQYIKSQKIWDYSTAEALIPKYFKLSQIILHESSLINWLKTNNLYSKFKEDHKKYHYVSDKEIILQAQQYKTKTEIKYSKKESANLWCEIIRRGLQKEAFAHLENGYLTQHKEARKKIDKYTKKELFSDCINYVSLSKWKANSPNMYKAADIRNLLLICKEKIRLNNLRNNISYSNAIRYENNVIHPKIANVLKKLKIQYFHEQLLGKNSRPDFTITINNKIFILEAKSDQRSEGNPAISKQIKRYKKFAKIKYQDQFGGVLLVSDHLSHARIGAVSLKKLSSTLKTYQHNINY